MFLVIGNQIIPLTGNVSGFLLSQQMVQYHVLNFLMLCCVNKKGIWQEEEYVASTVTSVPIYLPCCIISNIIYIASEKIP